MGHRLRLAVAWAAWTIKPTINRMTKARDFLRAFFLVPSNNLFGLLRRRLSLKNEKPRSQEKIRSVETSSDARKLSGGNACRILRGLAYYVAASPDRLDRHR